MKPSFLLMVAAAAMTMIFCASFSSGRKASPLKHPVSLTVNAALVKAAPSGFTPSVLKDNTHYYWYLASDAYDGWYTIAQETSRLETIYGVYVDGNPGNGGYLLATAYGLYGTPHMIWPSYFLYGH
jgi:hypothetical protein